MRSCIAQKGSPNARFRCLGSIPPWVERGSSSDGRALHSHCRGQGFDPFSSTRPAVPALIAPVFPTPPARR